MSCGRGAPIGGSELLASSSHKRQKPAPLTLGLHPVPSEVLAEAHVCVQASGVLVEVEERPRTLVEDAPRLLDQPRQLPQLRQDVIEVVESVTTGVSHADKVVRAPLAEPA